MINWLFNPSGLTPHGFCLLWQPGMLWTHALADFVTGATYFSIPITLVLFARKRPDILFRPVLWLFAAFILLCGVTHWLDLATLWLPIYGAQGVVKVATAIVSCLTAFALWRLLPIALAMPSLAQLRDLNQALRQNKDFLNRIGNVAGVGGWEIDVATSNITWTSETYRIHGVPETFKPTIETAIDFYAPKARPIILFALELGMSLGKGWDLELPFVRANGEHLWVRAQATVTLSEGKPVRITGAFQDITAHKTAQLAMQHINDRITLATDSGRIGIWDWNLESGKLTLDEWMYRLYGLDPKTTEIDNDLLQLCLHPEDRGLRSQAIQEAIAGVAPYDTSFRIFWPDGSLHHIRAAGRVSRDANGRAVRMIGANWDVTEATTLSAKLKEQHELLRVTLESIGDGVITTDARGRITWLNPIAERLTGWLAHEAAGRPLPQVFRIFHEETRQVAEDPLRVCMVERKIAGLAENTVLIARNGTEHGVADSASPIFDSQGNILGSVLVFHDVTEQRRITREMTYRASHDSLTGLVNRTEFEERLRRNFHYAQAEGIESTLLYLDLDQFKIVNDSCGHTAGDLLLQQVAKSLSELVRTSDTVARLGGDEFGIILENCATRQAAKLAQNICDRMDDYRFVHDGKRFRIGVSIGLVPLQAPWPSLAAVQQAADSACYAAKEAGRNRVHVWCEGDAAIIARKGQVHWASRLERALDENEFVLFFQQMASLQTPDDKLHAEILLRLRDHDGTLVAPGTFIPAAERFNLASRIDRWVFQEVLAWLGNTPHLARIGTISINLSGQSVGDRAFHRWAADALAQAGSEICRRLCLEITETAVVTNIADASAFIDEVHAFGVRVALDDFGAGASSFGYLRDLPVDILKIDGQFIRGLLTYELDKAAVRCFVQIAKAANMQTIAEWVDEPELMHSLTRKGVDFAQGYLIHRPLPLQEFGHLVQTAMIDPVSNQARVDCL
jgi:diguanylate cyclase (GGDEF)-like protein/PAS domain S-box-containing protein